MSEARLSLYTPSPAQAQPDQARPIGRLLVDQGAITNSDLVRALDSQRRLAIPLGELLLAEGKVTEDQVLAAVAGQHGLYRADLLAEPPDPRLLTLGHRSIWLTHCCVPWMRLGGALLIACARPDQVRALMADLPDDFPPVVPVVAAEADVMTAISHALREELTAAAENRVEGRFSCRNWRPARGGSLILIASLAVGLLALLIAAPIELFAILSALAVFCLFLITALKLTGAIAQIGHRIHQAPPPPEMPEGRWPRISVMVPLFKETEIAEALVRRLQRLTYPKVLLDVILVLEETDAMTRDALARCDLPFWMRVVEVPDGGGVTTKPRALNYALDFCRGEIIGIWDAEDAPAPDQLHHVAAQFARADPDVVCLQGILDYYNPRANWIARCFTIEYASWFRVVLPGLARLGLVIPLGGTTLFLRRDKIHEMGGWDAHNVTEDADLGVRIARFGYRTEFVATPTHEEANCRPWRWIKQRSRWLKGFMVTYFVHMRHPRQLVRDIGWKRFLGLQAFFVGTLSQFLLAPVLWTFWLKLLSLPHPTEALFGATLLIVLASLFLVTEIVNIAVGLFAVSRPEHRFLMPWTVTMPLYFPLGAIASYKALYEVLIKPFYWDKTQHGHSQPERRSPVPVTVTPGPRADRRPAANGS